MFFVVDAAAVAVFAVDDDDGAVLPAGISVIFAAVAIYDDENDNDDDNDDDEDQEDRDDDDDK